jgi:hypothetical protein
MATTGSHGGSQVGGSQLPQKPIFQAVDGDAPTRAELVQHANEVQTYVGNQKFLLQYLGVAPIDMPPDPVTIIPLALSQPVTILRMVMDMDQRVAAFESMIASIQLETARAETATTRATSSAPPQQSGHRLKTPMPTRYNGKKGDPAFTFIAACNNYKTMEPASFTNQTVLVRWCLQQMEDKAGQWAIRQMMRMDEELDGQGCPPKELRKWKEFCEFFLTQFGDPGLIERAKQKWKTGMIAPSDSPMAAPLFFVPKKDGGHRMCIDYRKLNAITVRDAYPLPNMEALLEAARGSKVFSKFDLRSAYNMFPIRREDRWKMGFVTPWGLYEFNVMHYGFVNAPACLQRYMDHILAPLIY